MTRKRIEDEARDRSRKITHGTPMKNDEPKPALISWSTGKDAAWALHVLSQARPDLRPAALLTTYDVEGESVVMHGVQRALIGAQARATGLPVLEIAMPRRDNRSYEAVMNAAYAEALAGFGTRHVVFGDLFLEDVRRYREKTMAGSGFEPVFPLWGIETRRLAEDMLASGLEAYVVCVDTTRLDRALAGARFDRAFLDRLPEGIDPCGENGEFHTFVTAG
ncbi:MAG: hypothetical protein FJX47_18155, partial [Alphaproteobacteria bacterium]|nr:hypothetical protein [Alphaproteobacteria bacterium]